MVLNRTKIFGIFDAVPVVALIIFLFFVVSGKFLIKYVDDYLSQSEVNSYTQAILSQTDKIFIQAKEKIHEVNRSPYEFCSSDDLRYIRNIIYSSGYISDIGRVENERLYCSALLGKETPQWGAYTRGVLRPDGSVAYGDIPLFASFNRGAILNLENINLVFHPGLLSSFERPFYSYSVYAGSPTSKAIIRLFHYPAENNIKMPDDIKSNKSWLEEKTYFEKLCSQESNLCVITAVEKQALMKKNWLIDTVLTVLSLVIGGLAALLLLRFFHNAQTLAKQLIRAMRRQDLEIYYQPIVHVKTGKLVAFEALIRWEIRSGEYLPADILIDTAEKAGFITSITCYVLKRVKTEMGEILSQNPDLRVNVNIAACDLQHESFYEALSLFKNKNIRSDQIGIELTERSAADSHAFNGIEKLRTLGYKVYLDDFGTGYSSLSLLGQVQVDALKMDKAFTQTVGTNALTVSIVPQIISIAKKYKLAIVVEGIETEEQAAYFKSLSLSVDAQGWYFGKPQKINEVYRLLSINKRKKKK
ncbi:EAL domain-containing protein [Brucellaceae bacterium C25G]